MREMRGTCLKIENPIQDAVSTIRFAPRSNNLLISSWDSVLRLYDVDNSVLRFEATTEAALLDCCFQNESVAFSVGTDGCIRRYELDSGVTEIIGNHDDLSTCVDFSEATRQVITAGIDKKIMSWDLRIKSGGGYSISVSSEVDTMSLCGIYLLVAIGRSINVYDLRSLEVPVKENDSSMDYQIRCVSSFASGEGYAVGSIDGRASLRFLSPSEANQMGCVFRCHPKSKDGRHHLVTVNDIAFHPNRYGAFVTGDNDGYAIMWDGKSRKRLFEYSSSVASLTYNCGGEILAVASSYTYQEANEIETPPQIFINRMDENDVMTVSAERSKQGIALSR
ncbi:mitotic checkpoint protein BUB3.3 isoform X2 [Telopea speciosissima]|uniref:mitotic checkpoint protein BUB3.3 isoform X2 n=1 Tax=Telopea speciosissima TaxID=54955 RepID=UPI001CC49EC3|nr:mitotic checkpoint protein BUB3.3 isoform X2 [Telopea speciosissima]